MKSEDITKAQSLIEALFNINDTVEWETEDGISNAELGDDYEIIGIELTEGAVEFSYEALTGDVYIGDEDAELWGNITDLRPDLELYFLNFEDENGVETGGFSIRKDLTDDWAAEIAKLAADFRAIVGLVDMNACLNDYEEYCCDLEDENDQLHEELASLRKEE